MSQRHRLFRRENGTFYALDRVTGKRERLDTKNKDDAVVLLHAKNEAHRQPALNLQIARAYLAAGAPEINKRTWQHVIQEIIKSKHDATQDRWVTASKDRAFDLIRNLPLLETHADHLLRVLERGSVSTNVFLRRTHNFALDMSWLPWPILPKKRWPTVKYGPKRSVTAEEHRRIVERETNPERRAFYELLWHLGGSQGDIASLASENIDGSDRVITYNRRKTDAVCVMRFGDRVAEILERLPKRGLLFPCLAQVRAADRATEFKQRCKGLGITGVTLHSYRYGWAERAKKAGYPERYAQEALGHNSSAVHRAYARRAQVELPALEEYERAEQPNRKIISMPADQDSQPRETPERKAR